MASVIKHQRLQLGDSNPQVTHFLCFFATHETRCLFFGSSTIRFYLTVLIKQASPDASWFRCPLRWYFSSPSRTFPSSPKSRRSAPRWLTQRWSTTAVFCCCWCLGCAGKNAHNFLHSWIRPEGKRTTWSWCETHWKDCHRLKVYLCL